MSELLALGTTAQNSADFSITAGNTVAVLLKANIDGAIPGGGAFVQAKSSDGKYFDVIALTVDKPLALVTAPGTYRVRKPKSENAIGIDYATNSTSSAIGSAASEAITVQGSGYRNMPTVTRPNNTTAYTAGDVIGNGPTGALNAVIEFQNIGPAGGYIFVLNGDLRIDVGSVPSGMANMRLHLYDLTPASALADNAAWDLPAGDRANYLGYIDFGTPVDMGATLFVQVDGVNKPFKLAAGQTSLWGYLQTIGGFTPGAANEVYNPRLRAVSF